MKDIPYDVEYKWNHVLPPNIVEMVFNSLGVHIVHPEGWLPVLYRDLVAITAISTYPKFYKWLTGF